KQATRRLKRLEERMKEQPGQPGPARPKPDGGKPLDDDRLRELDKKLDAILKAIESLKKERQPQHSDKPEQPVRLRGAAGAANEVMLVHERKFALPFQVDANHTPRIRELKLFSSGDGGRTWKQIATATPDKGRFEVEMPDGLYWLTVVVIDGE